MARAKTVTEALENDPNRPWGTIPPGALRFICNIDGKRQTWENEVGVVEHEFPIEDLSLELIRERWGDGAVLLAWQGEKDGRRVTCGTGRRFTLNPLDEDEQVEPEAPFGGVALPVTPQFSQNPIQEAFALLAGLESMADKRAMTINSMKNAEVKMALDAHQANANTQLEMMRLVMGREDAKEAHAAQAGGMVEVMKSIATAVEALGARMTALESDDGEEDGPGMLDGMTIQPGQGVGEVAAAVAMNAVKENLPGIVTGLAGMAQGYAAKMAADAQERKQAGIIESTPRPQQSYMPAPEPKVEPKVTVETRRDNPNPNMPAPEPKPVIDAVGVAS